jgi:microcin C transport system substrate-binding protein
LNFTYILPEIMKALGMHTSVKLIPTLIASFWLALTPAIAEEVIIKSHGISTYGDLHYGPDFKHLDYVNPDAPKGGTYATWNIGTFDSLHPYIVKGRASHLASSFLFEDLMTNVADDPDALYGLIAESIEYPENRQWALFNLRPEAKFSDGSDITADDVVFTYNILLEKGIPSLKSVFYDIVKVEALDADRVKFTFRDGAATRGLPSLAASMPVFSKAHWAELDFAQSTLDPGLGSGPYTLGKVDVGRSVTMIRNPDYWGKDLAINKGRHNFDKISEEFFGEANTAFEAFKAGELLFRVEGEAKKWNTGYDFPAVDKKWIVREELPDGSLPVASGFFFNLRKDKFKDIRVREALGLIFNFEWTNSTLFYGTATRQDSFWENSALEATDLPSEQEITLLEPYKEHFPETLFTEPAVSPPVSGKGQLDRKLVRKANKLLDAAGWKLVNGVRIKDGEELTVEFMLASDTAERFISPYIDNMRKIGVKGSLAIIDASQFLERRGNHDYDVMTTRHVTSLIPDIGLRQWFNSANAPLKSRNLTGIQNPGIDALIEKALEAENREDMTVVIRALDRALRSLHIWVPRWYRPTHWVAYWDAYGHPEKIPPYALGIEDFWWWDQAKADKLKAAGVNIKN